eukprot:1145748-Pelagomonas_calceolata.AAC.4
MHELRSHPLIDICARSEGVGGWQTGRRGLIFFGSPFQSCAWDISPEIQTYCGAGCLCNKCTRKCSIQADR